MGCVPGALRLLVIPPTWQNIHFFLRAWELCWLAREERAYRVNTAGLFLALLGLLNDSIDDMSVAGTKHHDHRELEEESSPCFLSQKDESMIHRGKQSIKGQAWQQQQEAKGSHPWLYSNTGRKNKKKKGLWVGRGCVQQTQVDSSQRQACRAQAVELLVQRFREWC